MDDSSYDLNKVDNKLAAFKTDIFDTYQTNAKRFLSLPFEDLPQAGALLVKFAECCRQELKKERSPIEIVKQFFDEVAEVHEGEAQTELLFWFLKFIERQVVLFDAIEDAAFEKTHDRLAPGTLENWLNNLSAVSRSDLEDYRIRLVLTAHPTQFYPSQIIGILQDLTAAIARNDQNTIGDLLLQMAKTSFVNEHKPTPFDEAVFLCQYLDNIFYPTLSEQQQALDEKFGIIPAAFELGFWPGGDRDGNPNVTTQITAAVVDTLHQRILMKYLSELERLKHRLTFKHVWEQLEGIEARLQATLQQAYQQSKLEATPYNTPGEFQGDLVALKQIIEEQHAGLYADQISHLISAVTCFGFHYAVLDIRQDSHVHSQLVHDILYHLDSSCEYIHQNVEQKLSTLIEYLQKPVPASLPSFSEGSVQDDTLKLLSAVTQLQSIVGEHGLNRYIISHTQGAHHVLEVMLLCYWCGLPVETIPLDILPLFESIEDLRHATDTMTTLYHNRFYQAHLQKRNKTQTIMLGYSDGTKDGGYLTANWSIYLAKAQLSKVSNEFAVNCLFFDGRGGPPSRGGGNTHKFYRALVSSIPQRELQVTLQGQTISTNFGTLAAARFNIGQLYTAGLANIDRPIAPMRQDDQQLLSQLSELSAVSYQTLIHHPEFLLYLENITPMNFFSDLNIASRPPRRDKEGSLSLDNLRAITFVSSWSQMKQNVPGYYGFGSAVKKMIDQGKKNELEQLYENNLYFHTLVENTMQSLLKNYFPLTHYLSNDPEYGEFWQLLAEEAQLTESVLLEITGQSHLLAEDPCIRASIQLRESIVLPLQVIQQYALIKLRQPNLSELQRDTLKKLIQKTLPTNLNASRNSA
jgi:phosphoenolpyruvate carboxylase